MAKRARLTVDDVVQQYADSDDDCADFKYDPDEPVIEGSDDEFSDLEGDEPDDDMNKDDPNTTPDTPASSSAGASTSSTTDDSTWSTTIKRLSIHPFTSPVGPTQHIFSSPLEVFDLFFSPDLMEKNCEKEQCVCQNSNG